MARDEQGKKWNFFIDELSPIQVTKPARQPRQASAAPSQAESPGVNIVREGNLADMMARIKGKPQRAESEVTSDNQGEPVNLDGANRQNVGNTGTIFVPRNFVIATCFLAFLLFLCLLVNIVGCFVIRFKIS